MQLTHIIQQLQYSLMGKNMVWGLSEELANKMASINKKKGEQDNTTTM